MWFVPFKKEEDTPGSLFATETAVYIYLDIKTWHKQNHNKLSGSKKSPNVGREHHKV